MIDDIRKKKIGRELREWIFLGIKTGMRRAVEKYEFLKIADPAQAILQLKRGVDLPHRAEARIRASIQSRPGNLQVISEALALCGTTTITELQDELDVMSTYAMGLKTDYDDGATWDDLADDIVANVPKEARDWFFPIPDDYVDIWGE